MCRSTRWITVELQHKSQYSVRRRTLRPEVEDEIAQSGFGHGGLVSTWNLNRLEPVSAACH
jgi:hypothetical protein